MQKEKLTRAAVARRLGKSIATVRRLEGTELHPKRDPRSGNFLFDPAEVERLAAASKDGSRPTWKPAWSNAPVSNTPTIAYLVGELASMARRRQDAELQTLSRALLAALGVFALLDPAGAPEPLNPRRKARRVSVPPIVDRPAMTGDGVDDRMRAGFPELLTLVEVAKETRAAVGTVRHWIKVGKLRSVRYGRRRMVTRDALDQLLKGSEK